VVIGEVVLIPFLSVPVFIEVWVLVVSYTVETIKLLSEVLTDSVDSLVDGV
jgi:hypothetical protein